MHSALSERKRGSSLFFFIQSLVMVEDFDIRFISSAIFKVWPFYV